MSLETRKTTTGALRKTMLLAGVMSVAVVGALGTQAFLARTTPANAQAVLPTVGNQVFSFADLAEKVKPAVVSIRVKGEVVQPRTPLDMFPDLPDGNPLERFFRGPNGPQGRGGPGGPDGQGGRPGVVMSQGSGFVITPTGDIVTNFHVVKDATEVTVVFDDGTDYKATVVGSDEKTDVALIRIQSDRKDFPTVPFATKAPRAGDWVLAVGNPLGLGGSVTAGIISARGRDIGAGPYDDFLQIDASINKGNSGGPSFNLSGEVVGMNTAIYSPSGGSIGIGFAIPSETVQSVIGQLEKGGEVVRGWLGVQIQQVNRDMADSLGLKEARGAIVAEQSVGSADSPAAKAGIKAGDVILAVEGRPVRGPRDLARAIAGYAPNQSVKIKVFTSGKEKDIDVVLGKYPSNDKLASNQTPQKPGDGAKAMTSLTGLGLAVAPAAEVGEGKDGVVVVQVDANGAASERNIRVGDVILEVQGRQVSSAADVTSAMRDARQAGRNAVLLRVKGSDGSRFVSVPLARS